MKDFDHWFAEQKPRQENESALDYGNRVHKEAEQAIESGGLKLEEYEEYDDGTHVIGNAIYTRCCGCGKEFEYPLGRDEIDPSEITNPCCGGSPRCCP